MTIGLSLRNSIILSTILQEIKRKKQQAFKNSLYVFVYCLKLTNRPEITIQAHVFVLINHGKNWPTICEESIIREMLPRD